MARILCRVAGSESDVIISTSASPLVPLSVSVDRVAPTHLICCVQKAIEARESKCSMGFPRLVPALACLLCCIVVAEAQVRCLIAAKVTQRSAAWSTTSGIAPTAAAPPPPRPAECPSSAAVGGRHQCAPRRHLQPPQRYVRRPQCAPRHRRGCRPGLGHPDSERHRGRRRRRRVRLCALLYLDWTGLSRR